MEQFDLMFFESHFQDGKCIIEKDGFTVSIHEYTQYYSVCNEPPMPEMECQEMLYFADTLSLMAEGHYLKFGHTRIGVWKTYDRYGDLTEETDYEQGFNISWEKMVPILQGNQIDLNTVVSIGRNRFPFEMENGAPRWFLIVYLEEEGLYGEYEFDGLSGETIKKELKEYH